MTTDNEPHDDYAEKREAIYNFIRVPFSLEKVLRKFQEKSF